MSKRCYYGVVLAAILAFWVPTFAQKPAKAPAGSTAQCSDGTFSTAKTERGACSKHGGVKTWFGAPSSTTKEPAPKAPASAKAPAGTGSSTPTSRGSASAKTAGVVPVGSTGQCADGSYTRAKTQKGACSAHGGVKTWFAADTPSAPTPAPSASPTRPAPRSVPPPPAAAPRSTPAPAPAAPRSAPASSGKAQTVAPSPGTPENATAKCKDATYSFAKSHSGACSRHGGVAEWYK